MRQAEREELQAVGVRLVINCSSVMVDLDILQLLQFVTVFIRAYAGTPCAPVCNARAYCIKQSIIAIAAVERPRRTIVYSCAGDPTRGMDNRPRL